MEYITLANGYQLPMLGYGTLHIPPKQTKECVLKAFEAGYRLLIQPLLIKMKKK